MDASALSRYNSWHDFCLLWRSMSVTVDRYVTLTLADTLHKWPLSNLRPPCMQCFFVSWKSYVFNVWAKSGKGTDFNLPVNLWPTALKTLICLYSLLSATPTHQGFSKHWKLPSNNGSRTGLDLLTFSYS